MNDQKVVSQVYSTTDYSIFKQLEGNRALNQGHLKRLSDSMAINQLLSPIIVNEKYQIIDGQHRFNACVKNGIPVYFIVVDGYGLKEVQTLNSNMSNWKKVDYLSAYCDLGYPEYIKFRQLMEMFPDFNFSSIQSLASANVDKSRRSKDVVSDTNKNGHFKVKDFEEGNLVIKDMKQSIDFGNKITKVRPYYDGYNRRAFVTAMVSILKNNDYNHEKFLNKLDYMRDGLYHCANVTQYRMLIEDIYNHRSRTRISLRF